MIQPSTEARLLAQEELTTVLHAQIKQLSLDLQQSDQRLFEHVQQGFQQAHAFVQERFLEIDKRLGSIEATQVEHSKRFDQLDVTLQEILKRLPPKTE